MTIIYIEQTTFHLASSWMQAIACLQRLSGCSPLWRSRHARRAECLPERNQFEILQKGEKLQSGLTHPTHPRLYHGLCLTQHKVPHYHLADRTLPNQPQHPQASLTPLSWDAQVAVRHPTFEIRAAVDTCSSQVLFHQS